MELISNVVSNTSDLRGLYLDVLEDLSNILEKSYGPYGSNTLIQKGSNVMPEFTKDGLTILKNVKYPNVVERTVASNVLSITEHCATTVGDGTTSAVLMSANILDGIIDFANHSKNIPPVVIIDVFKRLIEEINEKIRSNAKEFDPNDGTAYEIAMISTNGDKVISKKIDNLYKQLGSELYIALDASNRDKDVVSIYDGLVLETGLIEECYINDDNRKVCRIDNPYIYAFTDPVDTPEMIAFFETILNNNIYDPMINLANAANGKKVPEDARMELKPTVIIAPKLSRDASSLMENISNVMGRMQARKRPPLLVITNVEAVDSDMYGDIISMCACRPIKKYIDPKIQQKDQEAGNAPTYENVDQFFGRAEAVECDSTKTTFYNPADMMTRNENGDLVHTDNYNSLMAFLQNELDRAAEERLDLKDIYHIKKRINSLKATLVEWHVGGISPADRDQKMAAIEDAVKNCRSTAKHGYGYGANFEGYNATIDLIENKYLDGVENTLPFTLLNIIKRSYEDIITKLYSSSFTKEEIETMFMNQKPVNIMGGDNKVISSIETDAVTLDAIAHIITMLATSNQYICPEPVDTAPYRAEKNLREKKAAMKEASNKED